MKKLVIIGGTGGLGKQLVSRFGDYKVFALGSSDLDITDYESVVAYFIDNPADVVINLSGYNYDTFVHKIEKKDLVAINHQIQVNINGTINVLAGCLPLMRQKGYGRVILMSSVLAEKPVISTGVYAGCKGFLDKNSCIGKCK